MIISSVSLKLERGFIKKDVIRMWSKLKVMNLDRDCMPEIKRMVHVISRYMRAWDEMDFLEDLPVEERIIFSYLPPEVLST